MPRLALRTVNEVVRDIEQASRLGRVSTHKITRPSGQSLAHALGYPLFYFLVIFIIGGALAALVGAMWVMSGPQATTLALAISVLFPVATVYQLLFLRERQREIVAPSLARLGLHAVTWDGWPELIIRWKELIRWSVAAFVVSIVAASVGLGPHQIHPMHSIIALAFAVAYLSGVQHVVRSLAMHDVRAATFRRFCARMIFAPGFVVLVTSWFPQIIHGAEGVLPVIAFGIGMAPYAFISSLLRRLAAASEDDLPLSLLEGMSVYSEARLAEEGISDCRVLYRTDLETLLLSTPYSPKVIADWVGQSGVRVHFGKSATRLAKIGIRTVQDITKLDEKSLREVAQKLDIPVNVLTAVLAQAEKLVQLEAELP